MIFVVGGGGGLSPGSAVIHVTAPVGSTISFSKGGVVAKVLGPEKSHVNAADSTLADWYYSVSPNNYGTWTVTGALGTSTGSKNVTITSNREYGVTIQYQFWIHKVGDGLSSDFSVSWTSGKSGTVNENEISCNYSDSFCCMVITPSIDLKDYSTLHFEYIKTAAGSSVSESEGKAGYFGFASNTTTGPYSANLGFVYSTKPAISSSWASASVDISAAQSSYYFKFCCWNNGRMGVRNVYLE